MPHFMMTLKYSVETMKALIAKPHDRTAAASAAIEAAGGKLHNIFMTFGEEDILVIYEAPDAISAAAASLAIGASGVASAGKTTVLMSMSDAVKAMEKANAVKAAYKPPSA